MTTSESLGLESVSPIVRTPPASATDSPAESRVTLGNGSSSVSVTVAVSFPLMVAFDGDPNVIVIVSSSSNQGSSAGVTVIVPSGLPERIVTGLAEIV